ncbi:MAG: sensor histidine kinase [Deferrisomatales bacterium]
MYDKLVNAFLRAGNSKRQQSLCSFLEVTSKVLEAPLCTLWKINWRSMTLSAAARVGYSPPATAEHEFVHPIRDSLIGDTLERTNSSRRKFYEFADVALEHKHRAQDRVRQLGLKRMVSVPIRNYDIHPDRANSFEAVLNIYLPSSVQFTEQIAELIEEQVSLLLSRSRLIAKERMMSEIIDIYRQRSRKQLSDVLHPVISRILPSLCAYEASSVFIWDMFHHRLSLAQTTGLKGSPKRDDVYYSLGQGLTGYVARTKEPIILEDLARPPEKLDLEHLHLWEEDTPHKKTTFMGIPIMSPSATDELVGVIRFANRLNALAPVMDYFSDEDLAVLQHACTLLALYLKNEQNEQRMVAFSRQMSHEIMTPAVGIRGTADVLIRRLGTPDFPDSRVRQYLRDINEQCQFQIELTRMVQFVWRSPYGKSGKARYKIHKTDLKRDVVEPAKRVVIPLAREEGVRFDDIKIEGSFPDALFVDNIAFRQVFFNLLNNAIKYRRKGSEFSITIQHAGLASWPLPPRARSLATAEMDSGEPTPRSEEGDLITVRDLGVGIPDGEKEKIFLLGYRTSGLEKSSIRGLGIGLAVVREIVEDFGGAVWVSRLRDPTEFSVFLPKKLRSPAYLKTENW